MLLVLNVFNALKETSFYFDLSISRGLTKFVSFKGQITSRTYSEPEPPKGRMQRNIGQFSSLCDWSKYQVSTPENRCIRLQVRDLGSRSEITVCDCFI